MLINYLIKMNILKGLVDIGHLNVVLLITHYLYDDELYLLHKHPDICHLAIRNRHIKEGMRLLSFYNRCLSMKSYRQCVLCYEICIYPRYITNDICIECNYLIESSKNTEDVMIDLRENEYIPECKWDEKHRLTWFLAPAKTESLGWNDTYITHNTINGIYGSRKRAYVVHYTYNQQYELNYSVDYAKYVPAYVLYMRYKQAEQM